VIHLLLLCEIGQTNDGVEAAEIIYLSGARTSLAEIENWKFILITSGWRTVRENRTVLLELLVLRE
jgi:hypothetical protein